MKLRELVDVLNDWLEAGTVHGKDTAQWEVKICIDNKEYEAHTVRFSSLDNEKISICFRSTEPKIVFTSTEGYLLDEHKRNT